MFHTTSNFGEVRALAGPDTTAGGTPMPDSDREASILLLPSSNSSLPETLPIVCEFKATSTVQVLPAA